MIRGECWRFFGFVACLGVVVSAMGSCTKSAKDLGVSSTEVFVYTALDDIYSRPVLDAFEQRTGITVQAVYDTEASKTTGLRTRLVAEKSRPRADVFWNNEVAQTILLKHEEVLEPYVSMSAAGIPAAYKDWAGYWTGFAARGRVIIYNTTLVTTPPDSVHDLLDPAWSGKACIAKPLFGTTATHVAAWFTGWGDDAAKAFLQKLRENQIAVVDSNGRVRDEVAKGTYAWGLTDTDDANGAIEDGLPVKWLFPDQGADGIGTLVIPNTVALIKGAPHADAGKLLIDFLLSPEVEFMLANMRSIQIPLNPELERPAKVPALKEIKTMDVAFEAIANAMPRSSAFVKDEFLQ